MAELHGRRKRAYPTALLRTLPLVALFALSHPSRCAAQPGVQGQWSVVDTTKWNTGATHMALLRGSADTSIVLFWNDNNDFDPHVWRYNPSNPEASPVSEVKDPGENRLFCAAQATLKDGRLLVAGGTTEGETGTTQVLTFDARDWWKTSKGWAVQDTMILGRWYPTITTLADGKVLVTSGLNYVNLISFGGVGSGGARFKDMRRLANKKYLSWNGDPFGSSDSTPSPRDGHVAMWSGPTQMLVFGGQDSTGVRNDLWRLQRTDKDFGERWNWIRLTPDADPQYGVPGPRTQAAAVMLPYRDGTGRISAGDSLLIYGGRVIAPGVDSARSDLWRLDLKAPNYRWERIVPNIGSGSPGPRYGHVLMMDPGRAGAHVPVPNLMVFGGRTTSSLWAPYVYGLPLPRAGSTGNPSWQLVADVAGSPSAREGAVVLLDPNRKSGYTRKAENGPCDPNVNATCDSLRIDLLLLGGKTTLSPVNELWSFTRIDPEDSVAAAPWRWRRFKPGYPSADTLKAKPPKRWRPALAYDSEFDRLLAFAGDTTGTGSYVNDVWAINMNYSFQDKLPVWQSLRSDSTPSARAGHTMILDQVSIFARDPELFDPYKASPQSSLVPGASAAKRQDSYPHMFLLSGGKLFWTGNKDSLGSDQLQKGPSYLMDAANSSQTWQTRRLSGFIGGSSVMFRPDTVFKFGGSTLNDISDNTSRIYSNVAAANWTMMFASGRRRVFQNATLLPTGQILITGGRRDPPAGAIQRPAQLWTWNSATGTGSWGDALADDLYDREYHSTALLLPDARVLVSGGKPSQQQGTIFAPPYLFNGGALATRPMITSVPAGITYDCPFTVTMPSATAIKSVALLRPSAVTHAFDMSQRYEPLPFTNSFGVLTVTSPQCAKMVPPGDYMLFIVDNNGVPSVGKWLRLQHSPQPITLYVDFAGYSSVWLVWNSPNGDCLGGQAAAYDLRYSPNPITETNFNQATQLTTGVPLPPGAEETKLVQGLQPCTTYYFAIKSRIEPDGWSCLSNVVSATTSCGGGGFGPMAASMGAGGWSDENTLLPGLTGASEDVDQVLFGSPPVAAGSSYLVRLTGGHGQSSLLDQLDVLVVDHAPAMRAFLHGEQMHLGLITPAIRVARASTEITTTPGSDLTTPFLAVPGDTVAVDLAPTTGSTSSYLAMRLQSGRATFRPDSTRVGVLESDSLGGWVESWRVYPRALPGDFVIGPLNGSRVRIAFSCRTQVVSIGSFVGASAGGGAHLALQNALHSSAGDVTAAVMSADTVAATLAPNDTLLLRFAAPVATATMARDVVLCVRGKTSLIASPSGLRAQLEERELPVRFALHQNEPNPFSSVATIRFDLPQRCRVKLEIFDLQGRVIKLLADAPYEAGRWSAKWDHRDAAGNLMRAGVYLYRMEAGFYNSQKKIVLLP